MTTPGVRPSPRSWQIEKEHAFGYLMRLPLDQQKIAVIRFSGQA